MQFYSDEAIEEVYKMRHAIEDVKSILNDLNDDKIIMKERTVLEVPGTHNTMLYMPCINTKSNYSILKTISIFPENTSKPVSQGVTLLSDLTDGQHIANLESSYLTRLRTGAMSAIATDKLAKQDAEVLCVIGTGGMAFEQVLGVIEVRNIKTMNLYNRTYEKAKDFKNDSKTLVLRVTFKCLIVFQKLLKMPILLTVQHAQRKVSLTIKTFRLMPILMVSDHTYLKCEKSIQLQSSTLTQSS
ncbi:frameshiftedornithine cyclodeaminase [Macrococcoides caseolyticum JCSC5402]|uniref:Frameshiftedornithine cyclodeaminase n=1 Tax=Macrococcus caseolyticus (strain JCSC5402) TaxID=458233 RepID=B9E9Z8_MACCJ|nr:frameshiftedornithine cyclodeaminase [Macrococcus caseolyticus JCSC5402]